MSDNKVVSLILVATFLNIASVLTPTRPAPLTLGASACDADNQHCSRILRQQLQLMQKCFRDRDSSASAIQCMLHCADGLGLVQKNPLVRDERRLNADDSRKRKGPIGRWRSLCDRPAFLSSHGVSTAAQNTANDYDCLRTQRRNACPNCISAAGPRYRREGSIDSTVLRRRRR